MFPQGRRPSPGVVTVVWRNVFRPKRIECFYCPRQIATYWEGRISDESRMVRIQLPFHLPSGTPKSSLKIASTSELGLTGFSPKLGLAPPRNQRVMVTRLSISDALTQGFRILQPPTSSLASNFSGSLKLNKSYIRIVFLSCNFQD